MKFLKLSRVALSFVVSLHATEIIPSQFFLTTSSSYALAMLFAVFLSLVPFSQRRLQNSIS